MYRTCFDPFEMFRGFWCGPWGGRRYYTRKERIEHLESVKRRLQQEIDGIDELIRDLKTEQTEREGARS